MLRLKPIAVVNINRSFPSVDLIPSTKVSGGFKKKVYHGDYFATSDRNEGCFSFVCATSRIYHGWYSPCTILVRETIEK